MTKVKNKNLVLIFLLLGVVLTTSCRKLITDQFPDIDPKPVVNSIVRANEKISVHLSLAGKLEAAALPVVENARIALYEDSLLVENLTHSQNGSYESNMLAEQGKRYTFHVNIPDFPVIVCETYLPHSELIRSIRHINHAGRDSEGLSCPAIEITFTTNPALKQYFQLSLHCDFNFEIINITDPVILGEGFPITVFSNRMIEDTSYTMYLEYTTNSAGSSNGGPTLMTLYPFIVELRTIDPSYYHYLRSLYLYEKNLFGSDIGEIYPPYQLYSNIEGGYGIIASFSAQISDTIFPER